MELADFIFRVIFLMCLLGMMFWQLRWYRRVMETPEVREKYRQYREKELEYRHTYKMKKLELKQNKSK